MNHEQKGWKAARKTWEETSLAGPRTRFFRDNR